MDCLSSARFTSALSFLDSQSLQHALRYLASIEARNYAESTLKAVVGALKCLTSHLPDSRRASLVVDLAQTTSQDISDYVSLAQKAELVPSTINAKLSILGAFFEFLREDGLMTHQPINRVTIRRFSLAFLLAISRRPSTDRRFVALDLRAQREWLPTAYAVSYSK